MISQNGKKIIERFVSAAKNLLMQNVTEMLQQWYGIWADGHTIGVEQLPSQDTDIVHTARMLRDRLQHLMAALPDTDTDADKERQAVGQLVAEQAFTQLNRFCALRMCEERDLIMESIRGGYESAGFMAYDSIAQSVGANRYERYRCYLLSVFDELSIELPAVFDRFSPFGLLFPDESTLMKLLELINDSQLSAWFDEQNAVTVNFWKEDETLGWMFQDYNSLEERRKMREASSKPRNSREMAVRNQFFTPEYVVRFLTDNSLGRIWYEMTRGESRIGEEQCRYMIRRSGEPLEERKLKEPTEILSLDPTCGSMHFGLYLYEVYEYIYMDAWDNQPSLLQEFREVHTRETFHREVPRLILENNIYGCEIDPRALQIAALSLWLRAQKSYSQMNLDAAERPLITRSNLVLAEAMPGMMHYLWADRADDMEYELCQLIDCKSLQAYLASPTGFFDYHFKRYTKSRRKAPIYWLLASEDGTVDYWVYYPKLSKNTLPQLIIRLREQQEQLRTRLNAALAAHDKTQESQIRAEQEQVEGMMDELNRILAAGYVPNHDDGVPVTAAPLLHLAASRPWRVECEKNMELLEKGDYDWSHLAMSMYPARVTQKAKKDWCMALTHGLEHICENKPKEKKARKKKGEGNEPTQPMLPF